MAAPRFHAPGARFVPGEKTLLTPEARHHAGRVLRMAAGDDAVLFDGQGLCARGPIAFGGADAWITVQSVERPETESPVRLTLVQSFVSPEKTDWIVEKAVELGVSRIVLAPAARSVTRLAGDRLAKRLAHWREVAVSACAQSGRCTVPEVETAPNLQSAFESVQADARILLSPGSDGPAKLSGAQSAAFAVGPEGGFSPEEIEGALTAGWQACLLGRRVLRTETAGLAALAFAQAVLGDFGHV